SKALRALPFGLMRSEGRAWYSVVRENESYCWRKKMNQEPIKKTVAGVTSLALILTNLVGTAGAQNIAGPRSAGTPITNISAVGGVIAPVTAPGVSAPAAASMALPSLQGIQVGPQVENAFEAMSVEAAPIVGAAA